MNLRRPPMLHAALFPLLLLGAAGRLAAQAAENFTFAALGCIPYAAAPNSSQAFGRIIAEINRHSPAFTVHLGDTMSSSEVCSDELLLRRHAEFNTFASALVYTPGDNEWTDTHSEKGGKFVPTERLAKIRALYFPEEKSLGLKPIPLVTQRREPQFAKFVENARWTHGGVVFATVHVVGSKNNHQANVAGALDEWRERDAANAAWIRATFAEARARAAPGVALFFQANPFAGDKGTPGYAEGFETFLKTVEAESRAFARPVLLVHADEHRFRLDVGMRFEAGAAPLSNVTRLETFGSTDMHAVLVTVDPGSTPVFLTAPLIVPGNTLPALPRPKAAKAKSK